VCRCGRHLPCRHCGPDDQPDGDRAALGPGPAVPRRLVRSGLQSELAAAAAAIEGAPWWLLLEAIASVGMSKADDVGTYTFDDVPETDNDQDEEEAPRGVV